MKLKTTWPLLGALFFLSLPAQADRHMAGQDGVMHGANSEASAMPMHGWSEGTVRKVAKDTGKVTIAHGPLENLGMPSMTMLFRVKDAAWLDQLKPGDRIRFVADKVNGAFTVMRYEMAK